MKKVLWEEMRRTEFEQAVKADAVVIIPLGSTEQHAEHLPVNTDTNICFSVAKRAAEAIDDFPVLVLPPVWMGYSPHHMVYPGTITLKYHTLVDMLTEIAVSVHAHGFRKIFFLTGHVGNDAAVTAMMRKLGGEDGVSLAIGYGYYGLPEVVRAMEQACESDRGNLGHAGEMETSMQLYLQPGLVDMSAASWAPGGSGDPAKATSEKGESVINAAVAGVVNKLRDFHSGKIEDILEWRKDIPEKWGKI